MNDKYGTTNFPFFVHIQDGREPSYYRAWRSYSYAASLNGNNRLRSDWSYLFSKLQTSPSDYAYTYVNPNLVGSGFESILDDVVELINENEIGDVCTCESAKVDRIHEGVNRLTSNYMSTICGETESYVPVYNEAYASVKPKNCHYTFFINKS